jgi:DUF1009 family protein
MPEAVPAAAGGGPRGHLAGGGGVPLQVAAEAAAAGRPVLILGIAGEAGEGIAAYPHHWVGWGEIGRVVGLLRSAGIRDVVMVGGVAGRPDYRNIRLDLGGIRTLPQILGLMIGGDDSLLSGAIRIVEGKGFRVVGAHEVAPGLVAPPGPLTRHAVPRSALGDLAAAWKAAAAIGALDIGQAAVAVEGRAVALEGAEGTDRMLGRVAELRSIRRITRRTPSGVLVKRAKPAQDLRVDMPTIGPGTVAAAVAAGLAGIAIEAGRVMIAERAATIAAADAAGLFLVAEALGGEGW